MLLASNVAFSQRRHKTPSRRPLGGAWSAARRENIFIPRPTVPVTVRTSVVGMARRLDARWHLEVQVHLTWVASAVHSVCVRVGRVEVVVRAVRGQDRRHGRGRATTG